jgi:type VI secretion system protein ImpA
LVLDLAPWLSPIDGANPSGEDLRNDPRFHEIERLMQPRIEVVRDDRNNPVSQTKVPVDWADILDRAEALRAHGRDLRLLVIVARAIGNERGPEGLADGLTLIARTIDEHWETLHPELRSAATPRDAALRRINALLQLQNPEDGALGDLRTRAAFVARGLGPVTGQDLERGTLDSRTVLNEFARGMDERDRTAFAGEHEQLVNRVRASCAALADQSPAELTALADGLRSATGALDAIETALTAKVGGQVLLPDLRKTMTRMLATLERAQAPAPAPAPTPESEPTAGSTLGASAPVMLGAASAALGSSAPAAAAAGRLATRQEVIACLDQIIEFYDRTEPASPIPFLARRMRRMVPMDFLELMEDLAPSGLKEFRSLAGLAEDKKAAARTQGEKT